MIRQTNYIVNYILFYVAIKLSACTGEDIEKRRPDPWNFLFIAGMWLVFNAKCKIENAKLRNRNSAATARGSDKNRLHGMGGVAAWILGGLSHHPVNRSGCHPSSGRRGASAEPFRSLGGGAEIKCPGHCSKCRVRNAE
ncbi:hypothetical protein BH20ACI2_BH20ACI2_10900 [soil metagenome]